MIVKPVKAGVITQFYNADKKDTQHPIHTGLDIGVDRNPDNVPVYAIKAGILKWYDFSRVYNTLTGQGSFGSVIYILGVDGFYSIYAHLDKISYDLTLNSLVNPGDFLGIMGNTGLSHGIHLHYEERLTLKPGNSRCPNDVISLYRK